jgi:hypothetical protein
MYFSIREYIWFYLRSWLLKQLSWSEKYEKNQDKTMLQRAPEKARTTDYFFFSFIHD